MDRRTLRDSGYLYVPDGAVEWAVSYDLTNVNSIGREAVTGSLTLPASISGSAYREIPTRDRDDYRLLRLSTGEWVRCQIMASIVDHTVGVVLFGIGEGRFSEPPDWAAKRSWS